MYIYLYNYREQRARDTHTKRASHRMCRILTGGTRETPRLVGRTGRWGTTRSSSRMLLCVGVVVLSVVVVARVRQTPVQRRRQRACCPSSQSAKYIRCYTIFSTQRERESISTTYRAHLRTRNIQTAAARRAQGGARGRHCYLLLCVRFCGSACKMRARSRI